MDYDQKVLEIHDLTIAYLVGSRIGRAVDGASLEIKQGEVFGLAGESGCGKSTLAWSVLRLLPRNARIVSGDTIFEGKSLLKLPERAMNREIRGKKITMIIQNTQESLNPVFTVGIQMSDILRFHEKDKQPAIALLHLFQRTKANMERRLRCIKMLDEMEIASPDKRFFEYPHQFSGGMKQRVMMAMSFMTNPTLLIADEPTTGLDVSVETYILDLFKSKISKYKISVLYITHNLRILSEIADRMAIMYAGTIVEQAPVKELLHNPLHPYTKALIKCLPERAAVGKRLQEIPGHVPSIFERTENCKFQLRCPYSTQICMQSPPPNMKVSSSHFVRCHNFLQLSEAAYLQGGA